MKSLPGHFGKLGEIVREDGLAYALAYDALRTLDRYPIIKKALGEAYWSLVDFEDKRQDAEAKRNDRKELADFLRYMRTDSRLGYQPEDVPIGAGLDAAREMARDLQIGDRFERYVARAREKAERNVEEDRQ